jgi:hypothetical protein
MSDPISMSDYVQKFTSNQRISGYGLEVTMHVPCPFCATPDWLVHRVLDTEGAYSRGAVCRHCSRGCRALVSHDQGGVAMRFVQTCGPEQPSWLEPKMPLESAAS